MAYVDGFIVPVPKNKLAAYRKLASKGGKTWMKYGALSYVETVADDVKPGKLTSFPQSVKLKDGLKLVFASLSDLPLLVATLEGLQRRGVAVGLTDTHCRAISKSLLWAIERRIGAAFTPRVCDAWIAFLAVVVSVLRPVLLPQRSRAA